MLSEFLSIGGLRILILDFILLLMLVKGARGAFYFSWRNVVIVLFLTKQIFSY